MMRIDWSKGLLQGSPGEVHESTKTLSQLEGIFQNTSILRAMDPNLVVYRVQAWRPMGEEEGGLFWGNTVVEPGRVDFEYFMTHGHFHKKRDRTEYYATIQGKGALILMDEQRKTWMEPMSSGTLHFIPPRIAHRVANTGDVPLYFVACWPSDAGYDYEVIRQRGFGARLLSVNDEPQLVQSTD